MGPKSLFWKIEEFAGLVSAVIMFLVVVVQVTDMFSFLNAPEEYINPHHLDTTNSNWKLAYLKGSAFTGMLLLTGLILYFFSYKNRQQPFWKFIRMAVTLFLMSFFGIGYYQWYLTGFDH